MKKLLCILILCCFAVGNTSANSGKSYKQIGKLEDISFKETKRVLLRVAVQEGLSRDELTKILTKLAVDTGTKNNAAATRIFAYRYEDIAIAKSTPYTAGTAVYAPNGKWEDSTERSEKKVSVILADVYFKKKEIIGKSSDSVILKSNYDEYVQLSNSKTSWGDENTIAKVPNGTSAKVLEKSEIPISSSYILTRYKVSLNFRGKAIVGWVSKESIHK